ncbi:MAG: hypothetical protein U5J78_01775 [Parasphingorhabdus sp.]|nr:hypothetical protein [Parasphingorhabdus sp.]
MTAITRARPENAIALQTQLSRRIDATQQQIATGARISIPSQDPASWTQISRIARDQADIAAWLSNIDRATAITQQSDTALGLVTSQLQRASELAVQAGNGTLSVDDRTVIAAELDAIRLSVNALVEQQDGYGQALFATSEPIKYPVGPDSMIAATTARSSLGDPDAVMAALISAVANNDQPALADARDALRVQAEQINLAQAQQGIAANRFEQLGTTLRARQIDNSEWRSTLADTDISVAIANVQSLLVTLQAAQATYARVEQSTLFDYLR